MTFRSLSRAVRALACVGIGAASLTANVWGQAPGGVRQAVFQQPSGQQNVASPDFVDAYGNQAIVPASYAEAYGGCGGGQCCPDGGGYGGGYCPSGCDGSGVGYGLGNGYEAYCGQGIPMDQCGPHYFDISGEYVNYQIDDTSSDFGTFTTLNIAGTPLLSGDSIESDDAPGFRLTGRYDVGPLSVLECSYMAVYDMGGTATAIDPNPQSPTIGNLFTVFSNFGTNPVGGGALVTERAVFQQFDLDSDLQTAEISYRRYWVGWSPRVTGTLLAGFRYTRLDELFTFTSIGSGTFVANSRTDNHLAGFQFGGDGWATVRQGLRVGGEIKNGIYNNHWDVENNFIGAAAARERAKGDNVAYIAEGRVMAVADILPSLSIKGGYEVLYMNELALATQNFNTASPFAQRTPVFNDSGEVLLHGFTAGLEYIW